MRRLFLLTLLAASSHISVQAADMKGGYAGTGIAPQMVEYGSLWYIRGDVSFATHPGPSVLCNCVLQNSLGQEEAIVPSVGMGYQITRYFRLEGSVEYRTPSQITFRGTDATIAKADLKSAVAMVNAYVDIPLMKNVTPYIGAGVGMSLNQLSQLNKEGVGCPSCEPTSWEGANKVSLAWAVMTGVAYDMNSNLKLDAGYRFISTGDASTSNVTNLGVSTAKYRYKDITAHDMRVGFRYMLD